MFPFLQSSPNKKRKTFSSENLCNPYLLQAFFKEAYKSRVRAQNNGEVAVNSDPNRSLRADRNRQRTEQWLENLCQAIVNEHPGELRHHPSHHNGGGQMDHTGGQPGDVQDMAAAHAAAAGVPQGALQGVDPNTGVPTGHEGYMDAAQLAAAHHAAAQHAHAQAAAAAAAHHQAQHDHHAMMAAQAQMAAHQAAAAAAAVGADLGGHQGLGGGLGGPDGQQMGGHPQGMEGVPGLPGGAMLQAIGGLDGVGGGHEGE